MYQAMYRSIGRCSAIKSGTYCCYAQRRSSESLGGVSIHLQFHGIVRVGSRKKLHALYLVEQRLVSLDVASEYRLSIAVHHRTDKCYDMTPIVPVIITDGKLTESQYYGRSQTLRDLEFA